MNKIAIFICFLLFCSSHMMGRTITGEVRSENDSTAIAGAICKLYDKDKLITAVAANSDGGFEISTQVRTPLRLAVSMVGYNPAEIVIESGKNVNVGTVYLSEGVELQEVVVTANSMLDAKGRTIVFPSGADVKASTTALSLFQKLPLAGLETNPINRTLSVDGGTPVILIDGVPSSMDDVNAIKANEIAKIEFTRVTPARYADKGNTGLLSITLKKRNDGGQIYAWGRTAFTTGFIDGNIRASYHQGASQFTLYYNPSWRNYDKVYDDMTESYIGDDFRVDLEKHDRNPFYYHQHSTRLKYNYSPNTSTLFSATFNINPSYQGRHVYADIDDSYFGKYNQTSHTKGKDLSPSLDLFFKRDFNEKNSLEAQVVGTLSSEEYRRSNEYIFSDREDETYIMDVDSRRHSLISEVSYTHNFSDKTSLSAGYQNTLSRSTNTYLDSDYKPILTENNNYLYARLGQQIGKLYFSVGTGAKMYWIKNDLNRRHFIRNLTNVNLTWNISDKWNLQAAFQYSPRIPSLTALTDYPQQQTPYLISNGNPDLKVSQSFLYQAMPTFRYKKFSASLLMTYRNIEDFVMSNMTYLGDKLFLSQSVNAKRLWYGHGNLNMRISDIAGFGANVNLGLAHYETMGENWSHHLTAFSGSFSVWWNKGPFTISYWRKIPGKSLEGNYASQEENGDQLSFEYQPDKHWTLGAGWMNLFNKKGFEYPSWGYSKVNPYANERRIENNGNMVVLTVSYSANFGSIFRSARRSLNNSDNGSSLLKL